jgi:hypothetical protein
MPPSCWKINLGAATPAAVYAYNEAVETVARQRLSSFKAKHRNKLRNFQILSVTDAGLSRLAG